VTWLGLWIRILFLFALGRGGFLAGLGLFGTVFGAAPAAGLDSKAVKGASDDVITDAWKIFHAAPANKHNRVFLEVVAFAGDISNNLLAIGEPDFGDFAQGRIGFLGGAGHDLHADSATLRALRESRRLGFDDDFAAALADKLIDGWHLFL